MRAPMLSRFRPAKGREILRPRRVVHAAEAAVQAQSGSRAGRPQPQTTGQPDAVGPFIRHSRQSVRPGYSSPANALGATIDFPLAAAPGYVRFLDVSVISANGATGGTLQPDTTTGEGANLIAFMQVKDAYGTPVWSGNGFELGYLVQLYSGQVAILNMAEPKSWPSRSAITAQGNGRYYFRIPFEIGGFGGYGSLAMGNAALQPSLHIALQSSGGVFSAAPTTPPTITISVDEAFYSVPIDVPDLMPPALGTTLQWTQLTATPTVGSASSQRIQLPRLGGYVSTIILVARDSTGARIDTAWPSVGANNRIRLYVDGSPVKDESIDQRFNEMAIEFPNVTRPVGVVVYSFKNVESQAVLGYFDSLEGLLPTTPGTLLEIECTPWGTFANSPATITAIVGQIVPRGDVVYGIEG